MNGIRNFVTNQKWLILIVVILISGYSVTQIINIQTLEPKLLIDPSIDQLMPEDHADKIFYNRTKETFGNDETLIIALESDTIFSNRTLANIRAITSEIEQVDMVSRVLSLSNTNNIASGEEGIEASPVYGELPVSETEMEYIRENALTNPIFNGTLISSDGTVTAIVVLFDPISDADFLSSDLFGTIRGIVERHKGESKVWYTGNPFIKVETTRVILHDLIWLPALVYLVLAIVLITSFRTLQGVLVPLATALVSTIVTLGIISLAGYSLNMVTAMVPALLMTLSLAYTVHIVSNFHDRSGPNDQQGIQSTIRGVLGSVTQPVLLAGITTAAGFLSLALSDMDAIRDFGIFTVIGMVIIILMSLLFSPALLMVMGQAKTRKHGQKSGAMDRFIHTTARFDAKHSYLIFFIALLLFAGSAFLINKIRVGTEYIGNFGDDSFVARSFYKVNESLSGANIFSVVLASEEKNAFSRPENLRIIKDTQIWLESQPEIGSAQSIVNYIQVINRALHSNDDQYLTVPDSRQDIEQILQVADSDDVNSVVDSERRIARIIIRAKEIDSDKLGMIIRRIERHLSGIPVEFEARVTGNPVLLNKTIEMISEGQAVSISFSLVIVYCILAALFMSFRIGLVALIPNVLPISIYYGSLALFDITLNPATSLIGPMVLGIAVDDTIHYFTHFNKEAKRLASDQKATISTLHAVGRPITFTTTGLCLGFLIFLFSDLKMQNEVGMMAAFTLFVAWMVDFVLTPALCSKVRIATLWDALTLDLGKDPHKSIPLLSGLRATQARLVALMASIVEKSSGTRLIQEGDEGKELYVVISGKLESSYDGDNGRVVLNQHTRGDVVGEIGLFNATRSANVDVQDDARLLRITPNSIERMKKRYPRIAAQLLNNLSEVLAQRLIKATARIAKD